MNCIKSYLGEGKAFDKAKAEIEALVKQGKSEVEAESIVRNKIIEDEYKKIHSDLNKLKKQAGLGVDKYEPLNLPIKTIKNDSTNKEGVRSVVGEGEKVVKAEPKQEGSGEKISDNRDVQTHEKEKVKSKENFSVGEETTTTEQKEQQSNVNFVQDNAEVFKDKKGNTVNKIIDVGEKIGGAKKDLAKSLAETTDNDIENLPLSKSFPEPNYKELVENGKITKDEAIFLKYLYDNIPPKPRKTYRVSSWANKVRTAIDSFHALFKATTEERKTLVNDKILAALGEPYLKHKEILEAFGFPKTNVNMGSYEIKKDYYKSGYYITKGVYIIKDGFQSIKDAVEYIKEKSQSVKESNKKIDFGIYQDRKTGLLFVGKKGAVGVVRIMEGIPQDLKEAGKFVKENYDTFVSIWNGLKEVPSERRLTNRKRVGTDWRNGENISGEKFAKTFGFRGVEFGNWVNNEERQANINEAYDSLMDMANIIGVSPKAISLNGELGLAFGARGSGKAMAHYERDKVVINLTKTKGAGSLAHEWFHALDNYFSRVRGKGGEYITDSPYQMVNKDGTNDNSIRKEVLDAFKNLIKAIKSTDLQKRSFVLDSGRSKVYWGTTIEMGARSFENFIIEKLNENNEINDYLANIKDLTNWISDSGGNIDANKNYPYPLGEENAIINNAFQELFDVIEEKEVDGKKALYSVEKESIIYTPEQKKETQKIIDFFNKAFGFEGFAPLSEFQSKLKELGENVKDITTPQGKVLGFVSEGKIYLNPNALSPETTFHELTHVQQQLLKQAAQEGDKNADAILKRFDELLNDALNQLSKSKQIEIGGVKIDLSSEVYNQGENESDADYRERMRDELWAYIQSPENVKKWEAASKTNKEAKGVLDFIKDVIEWFKDKLGIKDLTIEQIQNATLQELIDHSSNALMKGEYFDQTQKLTEKPRFLTLAEFNKQREEKRKAEQQAEKEKEKPQEVKSKFAEALEDDKRFGEVFVDALNNATYNRKRDKQTIEAVTQFIKDNGLKEAAQKLINGGSGLTLDEQSLAMHSLLPMLREQGETQLAENLADKLLESSQDWGRAIRNLGGLKSLTEQEFLGWVERKFAKARQEKEGLITEEITKLKEEVEKLKASLAEEVLKNAGQKQVTKDKKEGILRRRANYVKGIKEYFQNKQKVGFAKDFEQEARNDIKLFKDLVGLVSTYLEEGIVKITDISNKLSSELGIEDKFSEGFTKELFDKARERQLVRKINQVIDPQTLSKIIRSTNIDENYINNLSEQLQKEGLSEIDSKKLAQEVKELITDKITKLVSPKRRKVTEERKKELAAQKDAMVQNLFNLNREAVEQYAKEKLGIPSLTEEDYAKLKELRNAYMATEKNSQEQADRFYDMSSFILTRTDKFSSFIALRSLMYFNMLSGIFTHFKNILSNAVSIIANLPVVYSAGLMRGENRNYIFKELADGILGDLQEGKHVLKTGYSPIRKGEDLSIKSVTEAEAYLKYGDINKIEKGILSASSFVGRLLRAADTVFYMMQYRVMASVKAHEIAKEEGLSGREYQQRVKEIINNNEVDETAKEIALRATFNNTPYGVMGIFYKLFENNPIMREGQKRQFAKAAILPFVRVPLNVLNEKLNWSPIGIGRGLMQGGNFIASKDNFIANVPFKDNEIRRQTLVKGLLGTAVMFAAILANNSDDDDDEFYITSFLDSNYKKRNQLINQGVKPNSIKIGDAFIPYDYFGQLMPLFIAGVARDYRVHEDNKEDDTLLEKLQFLISQASFEYYSQAGLDNLSTLMKVFSSDVLDKGTMTAIRNSAARAAATATIGNNFVMQMEKIIWNNQYEANDFKSAYMRNTPLYVFNDKKYNSLGEEIEKSRTPMMSLMEHNESTKVYKLMNKNNYLLQGQSANTILSGKGDDAIKISDLTSEQKARINKFRGEFMKKQILSNFNALSNMDEKQFKEKMSNISEQATSRIKIEFKNMK